MSVDEHSGPTGLAPRAAAFGILRAVHDGEPFDQALNHGLVGLEENDRRLAHELAAGVLRHRNDLDARLEQLVHRGWSSVTSELRDVLRIGVYQLGSLDRVPPHAAVSTTVELARSTIGEKAAKFANAILRGVGGRTAPRPVTTDPSGNLADRYSHPEWLVRRWVKRFGMRETEELLAWNNRRPTLMLQPARWSLDQLQKGLWEGGVAAKRAPYDSGLALEGGRPQELPGYGNGAFIVQDGAQALVTRFAAIQPGAIVFDACAAPGGKSIVLGQTAARVIAAELRPERARRLSRNLERAGSGREHVLVASAAAPPCRPVDVVLLDAPCLGTGSLRRHPDARWRISPEALVRLAEQQRSLLDALAPVVRPGGSLVYATCSLEPEENEQQVNAFIQRHPGFRRDPTTTVAAELLTPDGDLLVMPQRHGLDGAFAARLTRTG